MKLFIAGLYTSNFNVKDGRLFEQLTEQEKAYRQDVPYKLESYHYVHRQSFVDKMRDDNEKVFVDSGAFSSFTKGVEVDLEAYCRWLIENDDIVLKDGNTIVASVLDHIGSDQGTYANQVRMEKLGVRPLPCFHSYEDTRYLDHYVKNYEYITLGGLVPLSNKQMYDWLDMLWDKHLTDGAGRPLLKVHGFGVTSPAIMRRYPWYSCDSSSWVQVAANGGLYFNEKALPVSSNSPAKKIEGQHLDNLAPPLRDAIINQLLAEGFDPKRVQEEYLARWVYNAMSYTKLGRHIDQISGTRDFVLDQPGLF
ncbi:hypothetical protein NVP2117O_55 [Vibrio phage 2.117.O._10N.261.45.E9]|nr:hypothetical protein NVP1117O_55 [Vibrio phage 1.117.O._10N.261.45.E9]AUR95456.1 hypothetical protein NVP1207B_49 [Vibrio phage 1.207.B._10N.222.51.C2]AUS02347.1 hypothetical protein NVP2117O_55 [Vibrio phage 2.117.O._10N.261.45.E9]